MYKARSKKNLNKEANPDGPFVSILGEAECHRSLSRNSGSYSFVKIESKGIHAPLGVTALLPLPHF
jgi:hypothetical protein